MAGRNSMNPELVSYNECRRNHALTAGGGDVFDGCREFAAAGEGDMAMICQACGCHRSFHRREIHVIPPAPARHPRQQVLPVGTPFVVLHRPGASRHLIVPVPGAVPAPTPARRDAREAARAEIEGEIDFEAQIVR